MRKLKKSKSNERDNAKTFTSTKFARWSLQRLCEVLETKNLYPVLRLGNLELRR